MTNRPLSPAPRARRLRPLRVAAVLAGLAVLTPGAAQADAAPAEPATPAAKPLASNDFGPIRPVAGVLLTGTFGSDSSTVVNPDGSAATGSLGERGQVFAGAEFGVAANGLKLRLTGGVQGGDVTSAGGHERFTRFPLEATLLYPLNDRLRIGGGVRYATRLRFSGPGRNTSDQLNATPSVLAVVDYRLFEHLLLDARYVYERYELSGGDDQDGSHFGIGATFQY